MFENKSIAVVVPAHNEEKLIQTTLSSIPDWVDRIFVVDDQSRDATVEKIKESMKADARVELIEHEKNQGVGGAIATGYKAGLDNQFDVTVVMAGDAQMDPEDLPELVRPVAVEGVDYAKGNRLFHGDWRVIPRAIF